MSQTWASLTPRQPGPFTPPVVPGSPKEKGTSHPFTKGGTLTAHASSPERETTLSSFAWELCKHGMSVPRWVAGTQRERQARTRATVLHAQGQGVTAAASPIYPSQLHQGALGFDCHGNDHSWLSTQNTTTVLTNVLIHVSRHNT